MNLLKVTASNFFSYKSLIWELGGAGLYLVKGIVKNSNGADSNGAGKSTLAEMITWGLFGKLLREAAADDVINNNVGKNCFVELDFGKYEIKRYRKHKKYKNNVYLYKNGKNISGATSPKTQEKIEALIGMDYQVFINTHMFGLASSSFLSAKDTERKNIIDYLSGGDYSGEQKNAIFKLKELQVQINDITLVLIAHESRQTKYQGKMEVYVEQLKESRKKLKGLKIDYEKIDVNIDKELLKKSNRIVLAFNKVNNLELDTLYGAKGKLEQEVSKLNDRLDLHEIAMDDRCIVKHDIKRVAKENRCTLCKQLLKTRVAESNVQKVFTRNLKEAKKNILSKKEIRGIENRKAYLEQEVAQAIKFTIKVAERNNTGLSLTERMMEIKQDIKKVKVKLEQTEVKREKYERKFNTCNIDLKKTMRKVSYYVALNDMFKPSGVLKAYTIIKVLPLIAEKVNQILQSMRVDVKVDMSVNEKGKIDVRCYVSSGADKFTLASTGQKARADFAMGYALRSFCVSKLNIVFFDDVFNDLDETGADCVIQALKKLRNEDEFVFCISPKAEDEELFGNRVIVVENDGKESRLIN